MVRHPPIHVVPVNDAHNCFDPGTIGGVRA